MERSSCHRGFRSRGSRAGLRHQICIPDYGDLPDLKHCLFRLRSVHIGEVWPFPGYRIEPVAVDWSHIVSMGL